MKIQLLLSITAICSSVLAKDISVERLTSNGNLVFTETSHATNYYVEQANSLDSTWTTHIGSITPTGNGSITCSVPVDAETMFFRVGAQTIPGGSIFNEMVEIPGGTNSGTDPDFGDYSINVDTFYMDKVEITNDEMVRVLQWAYEEEKIQVTSTSVQSVGRNKDELIDLDSSSCRISWDGSSFGIKSDHGVGYPCVEVTWHGAVAYCNFRSEIEGRTPCYDLNSWLSVPDSDGYRLPTPSQWEYAARGGLTGKRFPWGDTISHSQANYRSDEGYSYDISPTRGLHPDYSDDESSVFTNPGRVFPTNGYGLYDMIGNVREWCWDGRGYTYVLRPAQGGAFFSTPNDVRCRSSLWTHREGSGNNIGFRAITY